MYTSHDLFCGRRRKFSEDAPVIVFKAQPEGYDDEDSDWEGDVEVAPLLILTKRMVMIRE